MTQKFNVIDTISATVDRHDDFVNNNSDSSNKFLFRQVIFVFVIFIQSFCFYCEFEISITLKFSAACRCYLLDTYLYLTILLNCFLEFYDLFIMGISILNIKINYNDAF